jgi:alkylhydroperoxidase family enzyme
LEYAELMALEHTAIGDDFFRRLREEFTDAEIVELTMAIGQYIGFGRFLHVLEGFCQQSPQLVSENRSV